MRGIDRRGGMSKNSTHCRAGEMPLQYLVFYELLVLERLHLLSLRISPNNQPGKTSSSSRSHFCLVFGGELSCCAYLSDIRPCPNVQLLFLAPESDHLQNRNVNSAFNSGLSLSISIVLGKNPNILKNLS